MTTPWTILGVVAGVAVAVLAVLALRYLFTDSVQHYPGGGVRARGHYNYGDRHGPWTFYYESGQKECEGAYVAGFEAGVWTFWHENGSPRARGAVGDDGGRQGDWQYWDRSGQPLTEAEFLASDPNDSLHRWPTRRSGGRTDGDPAPAKAGRPGRPPLPSWMGAAEGRRRRLLVAVLLAALAAAGGAAWLSQP